MRIALWNTTKEPSWVRPKGADQNYEVYQPQDITLDRLTLTSSSSKSVSLTSRPGIPDLDGGLLNDRKLEVVGPGRTLSWCCRPTSEIMAAIVTMLRQVNHTWDDNVSSTKPTKRTADPKVTKTRDSGLSQPFLPKPRRLQTLIVSWTGHLYHRIELGARRL